MATYKQLKDGTWGVKVEGKPEPGTTVTVTKRSGEQKLEQIASVLWSGPDEYAKGKISSLCTIVQTAKPIKGKSRAKTSRWYTDGERNYHGHQYSRSDPRYYSSGQYDDES